MRNGILKLVDKSFKDRNFHWYHLSHDLFQCLNGQKKVKDERSSPPPKPRSETQDLIDLTLDDSSDDSKDANTKKHSKDANTKKHDIPAATTNSANPQLNLDCTLTDSNHISAKKYDNGNEVVQPKMTTPVNTTGATTSSDEPQLNPVQAHLAQVARTSKQLKKKNKKKKKKKKKDEQKHPILRCEIPWNELDGTLKNHMMALGFRRHSWQGGQGDLPAQFLFPWDGLNSNLKAAAGAFGCTELSWNNKEPESIFIEPKLLQFRA